MNIASVNKLITLAARVMDMKKSTEAVYVQSAQKPSFEKRRPKAPLERTDPESVGIKSECINDLLEKIFFDKDLNVHGIMIIRNNKIITEASFGGYDFSYMRYTFSQCKSIVALAIGCLIDEGRLELDSKVTEILAKYNSPVSKLRLKKLTVRDLLTMRSSVEFAEADTLVEKEWRKGYFAASTKGEIGESFAYNSLNTYMLASIVTEITGVSLTEYLEEKIFTPLDIDSYFWEKSPEGIEKGGWGLFILPEDMAKIALTVVNKGVWNGKRIVSEEFILDATTAHVKTPESIGKFDYGYQMWCGKNSHTFLFNGMFGQNALGFLDNGVVVITIGGNNEMFQSCPYYGYLIDAFNMELPGSLRKNRAAAKKLEKTVSLINNYCEKETKGMPSLWGKKSLLPKDAYYLDGRVYNSDDADAPSCGFMPTLLQIFTSRYTRGLESVAFDVIDNSFYMTYTEKNESIRFEIGFDSPKITEIFINGEYYHIAVKGKFTENEDGDSVLVIRADLVEMPSSRYIKFYYKGQPYLKQYETPGGEYLAELIIKGKNELSQNPALGITIGKLDDEYLRYKVDRVFAPDIKMKLVK